MKLLYAAGNNSNARFQLSRFLQAMQRSEHQIKIAAYQRSSPPNISVDWTLDCLLNMFHPDRLLLDNDNLQIYYQQVKQYAPDLVISDLEYFTSYVANLLNLPIWQCSSSIVPQALSHKEKYGAGIFKYYAYPVYGNTASHINHLLASADRNLVYSHLGEIPQPPTLNPSFQWVRPYHQVGKVSVLCHHNLVAILPDGNKQVLNVVKNYVDSVVFTADPGKECYTEFLMKDIDHLEEYYCNLKNSSMVLCRGQGNLLADAFYNGKYALVYPDYQDAETLLSSQLAQHFGTGSVISLAEDLSPFVGAAVIPHYDSKIKYLHQYIEEL